MDEIVALPFGILEKRSEVLPPASVAKLPALPQEVRAPDGGMRYLSPGMFFFTLSSILG